MKRLTKKLEDVFAAVSFAEAGEHETAREMLNESDDRDKDRPQEEFSLFPIMDVLPEED